jgi:hypothetical protein
LENDTIVQAWQSKKLAGIFPMLRLGEMEPFQPGNLLWERQPVSQMTDCPAWLMAFLSACLPVGLLSCLHASLLADAHA